MLSLAALDADQAFLVGVLMISSLLSLAYLLPIPVRGFLAKAEDGDGSGIREAPLFCVAAILITATGSVALFLFPGPIEALLSRII